MAMVVATLTVIMVITCLVMIGLLIYAFVEENPQVEDVDLSLVITAIIIGVIVSVAALTLY